MGVIISLFVLYILWKWTGLRAYAACSLFLIGAGAVIAGCIMDDHFFVMPGMIMLAVGLLISFLSVLRYERSQWLIGMVHFLIYGFMLFLRLTAIMIIIGVPIMALLNGMCRDWHEVIIVDSLGRDTGKKATIDSSGRDPCGNQYEKY